MIKPETKIVIERAVPSDAERITEISFAAKRIWNYPEDYFRIWKDELTIISDYVERNTLFKAVDGNVIAGYVSLVVNPDDFTKGEFFMEKGLWMEHLFVDPRYMKQGIGSALVSHVREFCLSDSVGRLMVFVDPNAAGFYVKTGAVFVRMSKSSIPGRDIPVYAYEWKTHDPDY